jgi:chromosome segregation ATPase
MTEHRKQAEQLEHEVDEMEDRSERLEEEISDVREDWERKRRDKAVPGAAEPESGLPPEANHTTSGDQPPQDDDESAPDE